MGNPAPESDDLIIESFARWAGDVLFARDSLERAVNKLSAPPSAANQRQLLKATGLSELEERPGDRSDTDFLPRAIVQWAEHRKHRIEKQRTSRQEREHHERVEKPEPIDLQHDEKAPSSPIIQGINIRAVVSIVNAREFELRGYPTNLNAVKQIVERARDAEVKFASAGRVERLTSDTIRSRGVGSGEDHPKLVRASGASWTMPGRLMRFIWVDAFGLILSRGTWTADEPFGSSNTNEVFDQFREVLQLLD